MSRVSITVPTLLNGVSQQPDQLRLTSQCESQVNFYGTISEGLTRRAPTQFLATLDAIGVTSDCFIHTIDRGPGERYLCVITNGSLRVFDVLGVERTVTFPNGKAYLAFQSGFTSAKSSFKCVNTNTETFVLNRGYTVPAVAGGSINANGFGTSITIKQGGYSTDYSIVVQFNNVTYTALKTTSATLASDIIPSKIAADLLAGFSPALPAALNATRVDNTILLGTTILPLFGGAPVTQFNTFVKDSAGGSYTSLVNANIANVITDLPKTYFDNFGPIQLISGTTPYYVRIRANTQATLDNFAPAFSIYSSSQGIWVETTGDSSGFDPSGLPWTLFKNNDGTFTFIQTAYNGRLSGDSVTAPTPSFTGNTIQDMVLYKGRLGFISGNRVIFSQAGNFRNFYPTTVTTALDNAPIDAKAEAFGVTKLQWAIQYQDDLVLFSDKVQVTLNGNPILTNKTLNISPTTAYDGSLSCAPAPAGQSVLFAYDLGSFGGIREYNKNDLTATNSAIDVTSQCKKYIPFQISKIVSSTYDDLACILTSGEQTSIYIYKYFYNGTDKIQSALSKWSFGGSILDCSFIGSDLFLVVNRAGLGTTLEKMTFVGLVDGLNSFLTYLDCRTTEAACSFAYSTTTGNTTITLPYAASGTTLVTRVASAGKDIGQTIAYLSTSGKTAVVSGDLRTLQFYVGFTYESRYRFSKQFPRLSSGSGGDSVDTSGRLALRKGKVQYSKSGYFRVEVTPQLRPLNTYTYTGVIPGTGLIGSEPNNSGVFAFAINTLNLYAQIDLVNDSPFPSTFLGAAFEGEYTTRSQRI